jgi:hypothetical protein
MASNHTYEETGAAAARERTRVRLLGKEEYVLNLQRSDRARRTQTRRATIDFDRVNAAALAVLPALLRRWLPDGMQRGTEFLARNPRRHDRHAGSFSVNVRTGKWADFACSDARGGDPVSLAAYLFGLSQAEAARRLADALGIPHA